MTSREGKIEISQNGTNNESCILGDNPCKSLSYVADHCDHDVLILINSPVLALSGDAVFRNVNNITITSQIGSELLCDCIKQTVTSGESCGLSFENSSSIHLSNLIVRNCSYLYRNNSLTFRSGIIFLSVTDINIINISVVQSAWGGLIMMNSYGEVFVYNSKFIGNALPVTIENDSSIINGGSGLLILLSTCDDLDGNLCLYNLSSIITANYRIMNSYFTMNSNEQLNKRYFYISSGGGLTVYLSGVKNNTFLIDNSSFTKNEAVYGGGLSFIFRGSCQGNSLEINECSFNENLLVNRFSLGGAGAAIGFVHGSITSHHPSNNTVVIRSSVFTNNQGFYGAGLLLYVGMQQDDSMNTKNYLTFWNCTWFNNTGSVSPAVEITPDFIGIRGRTFLVEPTFDSCKFYNNYIQPDYSQPLSPYSFYKQVGVFIITKLEVVFKGETIFYNNSGTALYASAGTIKFGKGSSSLFKENSGVKGGALALVGFSTILFDNDTVIKFIDNRASFIGGAIYLLSIEQHLFYTSHTCFIRYAGPLSVPVEEMNATFFFEGNTAESKIGSSMYLTSIEPCRYTCSFSKSNHDVKSPKEVFSNNSCIANFEFSGKDLLHIATEGSAFNVTSTPPLLLSPGRDNTLPLKVIDDFGQDVTNVSVYQSNSTNVSIEIDPSYEYIGGGGTLKLYGASQSTGNITLTLLGFRGISVNIPVFLTACPPGYVTAAKGNTKTCSCSSTLGTQYMYRGIARCSDVALVTTGYWVGYITDNKAPFQANENNLYTADCPSGFCQQNHSKDVVGDEFFPLILSPSKQKLEEHVCVYPRKGILCGECDTGHSVYFHSNTRQCSSNKLCSLGVLFYLLSEILPIITLFVIILGFNINLTSGYAYSILFIVQLIPAMIVTVNGALEFSTKEIESIHSVIYGTLNLDFFDVDTLSFCLWPGASALDMIAMKYVSVVFALFLTVVFVCFVNYFPRRLRIPAPCSSSSITKMHSVVHGLTAFFVICYFQSSRITFLLLNRETPVGIGGKRYRNLVFWNGNIEYFSSQHLYYALPALLFLFVITLPLPLILIFDQVFIKIETYMSILSKQFSKIQPWTSFRYKLKPVLDLFQGCFKDDCRYYAGLFFIYRVIILILLDAADTAIQYYIFLEIFLIVIFALQAIIQPFLRKRHNTLAVLMIANMAIINAFTMRIYTVVSKNGYTTEARFLQWTQLILIYIPLFLGIAWIVHKVYSYIAQRKVAKKNTIIHDNDFPEELFQRSMEYTEWHEE